MCFKRGDICNFYNHWFQRKVFWAKSKCILLLWRVFLSVLIFKLFVALLKFSSIFSYISTDINQIMSLEHAVMFRDLVKNPAKHIRRSFFCENCQRVSAVIFAKNSVLDVWQGGEDASDNFLIRWIIDKIQVTYFILKVTTARREPSFLFFLAEFHISTFSAVALQTKHL